MKKILMIIAVALSAICAWWYGVTPQDVIDAFSYCFDMINAVASAFMDYIMPQQAGGIRSFFASGYLSTRSVLGKIFGWQPFSVYDYVIDRAKANPLEAVGAVAVVLAMLWLIIFTYRRLYRFYCWMIIKRPKR